MDVDSFPPTWLVFSPVLVWFVASIVGIAGQVRWWPFVLSGAYSVAVFVYVVASY